MAKDPARHHAWLAVALGPGSMAEALAALPQARAEADALELRLDAFREPFNLPLLLREHGSLPLIATLRSRAEGGRSDLPDDDRVAVLAEAAHLGAEYVDLEWHAATPERIQRLREAGARVIVSRHDFRAMPDLAGGWWPELTALGPDVVKVVGTAASALDCLPVVRALRRADRPTIAIAMGDAGLATRVLAPREPLCLLTFGSLSEDTGTAPGQVPVTELRETYRADRLGPGTAVFGLLAPNLERDLAAQHNAWLAMAGLDAVAVPFVARSDAAEIVAAYRELPIAGWHLRGAALQQEILRALDRLEPSAQRQGRVNSVIRQSDGALVGGWVETPGEQFATWTGREPPIEPT